MTLTQSIRHLSNGSIRVMQTIFDISRAILQLVLLTRNQIINHVDAFFSARLQALHGLLLPGCLLTIPVSYLYQSGLCLEICSSADLLYSFQVIGNSYTVNSGPPVQLLCVELTSFWNFRFSALSSSSDFSRVSAAVLNLFTWFSSRTTYK